MTEEITLRFPDGTLARISSLSEQSGYSPEELVSLGIATAKLVLEAQERGHVLVEAAADGKAIAEIKYPEPIAVIDEAARKILADAHPSSLERAIADLDPDNEDKKSNIAPPGMINRVRDSGYSGPSR